MQWTQQGRQVRRLRGRQARDGRRQGPASRPRARRRATSGSSSSRASSRGGDGDIALASGKTLQLRLRDPRRPHRRALPPRVARLHAGHRHQGRHQRGQAVSRPALRPLGVRAAAPPAGAGARLVVAAVGAAAGGRRDGRGRRSSDYKFVPAALDDQGRHHGEVDQQREAHHALDPVHRAGRLRERAHLSRRVVATHVRPARQLSLQLRPASGDEGAGRRDRLETFRVAGPAPGAIRRCINGLAADTRVVLQWTQETPHRMRLPRRFDDTLMHALDDLGAIDNALLVALRAWCEGGAFPGAD